MLYLIENEGEYPQIKIIFRFYQLYNSTKKRCDLHADDMKNEFNREENVIVIERMFFCEQFSLIYCIVSSFWLDRSQVF